MHPNLKWVDCTHLHLPPPPGYGPGRKSLRVCEQVFLDIIWVLITVSDFNFVSVGNGKKYFTSTTHSICHFVFCFTYSEDHNRRASGHQEKYISYDGT
jgi:hypothetical protein